jgi:hypothetical protein
MRTSDLRKFRVWIEKVYPTKTGLVTLIDNELRIRELRGALDLFAEGFGFHDFSSKTHRKTDYLKCGQTQGAAPLLKPMQHK